MRRLRGERAGMEVDSSTSLEVMAAALDGIGVAMCLFDEHDRTVLWNRSFLQFFPEHDGKVHQGEPYADNLRRFFEARLGAHDRAAIDQHIEQGVLRHRMQARPFTFEHRGLWLRASSLPIPGVGRARVWSSVTPVRRSAAATQGESEAFNQMADGVMVVDPDDRIASVNEAFVALYRLPSKAAAVGRTFADIYRLAWEGHGRAELARFETGLLDLALHGRFAGAPFQLPLPGARWVRVVEHRSPAGIGYLAHVDITHLKRREEELALAERRARESEARLALLAEHSSDIIVSIDAAGALAYVSPAVTRVLGWSPGELAGRALDALVHAEDRAAWAEAAEPARRAPGATQRLSLRLAHADGSWVWLEAALRAVDSSVGGGAAGVSLVGSMRDISERKRNELRRQELEAQLREAHKLEAIGTLAGGIAHDFNNVMGSILGNVALARDMLATGHPAHDRLEQVQLAGRRARALVQQILAFSRRQPVEAVSQPIQPLVEETLALLRATLPAGVDLVAGLEPAPLHVRLDATQLQQVVMNLCANAWQAAQGPRCRIEVGLARATPSPGVLRRTGLAPGEYAQLSVRDDGTGMDAATMARIFEPFFTTKRVGEGTGLGLSVVHGIVKGCGGGITVDSAHGAGTTFGLYFPLADPETLPASLDNAVMPAAGAGQHVVVVDDDAVVVNMVQALLQRLGYRVTVASTPHDALEAVRTDPAQVDAVITDYSMPECSGLELARHLRALRPDLPVVISSGYVNEDLRRSAAADGIAAVMHKEDTFETLPALLHRLLTPA
jgi:PAS domain S-box-containing protein